MPAGRPTDYNKDVHIQMVYDYLASCIDDLTKKEVNLPSIEGFCADTGLNKSTVYRWREEEEDFRDALNKILDEQGKRLQNNGLAGTYNSTIAKLLLSANHGLREKQDITSDDQRIEAGVVILPSKE